MSAFDYKLTRSVRRKTLSIVIRQGQVKVMAPVFLTKSTIDTFVRDKTPWILDKLQAQQSWVANNERSQKQFVDGESFLYLGQSYLLQVSNASKSEVSLYQGYLVVAVSNRVKPENRQSAVKKLLQDWYTSQLSDWLIEPLNRWANQIGVSPTGVDVRWYKRRWGSCTSKGQLSFNFLLMMAPAEVIDYVIVHELAHLVHLNHSTSFWALVKRHYPHYKTIQQWLKAHGGELRLD